MPDLALRTQWFSERAETSSEIPKKVLAYPGHHPAIEAGKLGIVVGNFFFHHPAEGRGGSQSWVQGFRGKGGVPRRVFVPNTMQPRPRFGDVAGRGAAAPSCCQATASYAHGRAAGGEKRRAEQALLCASSCIITPFTF